MAIPKSPFMVYQGFLSAKACEEIVDDIGFIEPDYDEEGNPIKMSRHHEESAVKIYSHFEQCIPNIEQYYSIEHRGTENLSFEFLPEGSTSKPICENSNYVRKKWVRVRDRDLTCVLFLSDYQQDVPFDSDYEVYGGKLEFPQHNFGFNPTRGTLIVYPSAPHFINVNAPILSGDLFQVKFHLAATAPFLYNPNNFPGDYTNWFNDLEE